MTSLPLHCATLAVLATAVLGCGEQGPAPPEIHESVRMALEHGDVVDVIVGFTEPAPLHEGLAGHRAAIDALGQRLGASPGFVPRRRFNHVPAVAGTLSREGLAALAREPQVSFIQLDSPGHGALTVSVPAIGADVAKHQFHVTGKGVRVAVLDTGINNSHPDLESSIVATQHCFTRGACPPGQTSESTSAEDDHGHGSHVSGIITADGTVAGVGFAPAAEIVAVKVNDGNDSGYASDWAAGFDWVFTNLAALAVKVVNASFGTTRTYGSTADCERGEPALARAVKNLVDAGVTIFVASGNGGSTTHMSAPACLSGVITVGATYKASQGRQPPSGTYASRWGSPFADCADETTAFDQVACFTTSGPRLDLLAPGAVIVSDSLGSRTESYRGTSQASPTAAGIAALLLECQPSLGPAVIKDILVRTAVPVTDAKANASYPSIRADRAVAAACATVVDAGEDAVLRDTGVDSKADAPGGERDAQGTGGAAGASGMGGGGRGAGGSGGGGSDGSQGGSDGRPSSDGTSARTGGAAGGAAGSGGDARNGGRPGGSGGASRSRGNAGAAAGSGAGGSMATPGRTGGSNAASGGRRTAPAANQAGCACLVGKAQEPPALTMAFVTLGALAVIRRKRRR